MRLLLISEQFSFSLKLFVHPRFHGQAIKFFLFPPVSHWPYLEISGDWWCLVLVVTTPQAQGCEISMPPFHALMLLSKLSFSIFESTLVFPRSSASDRSCPVKVFTESNEGYTLLFSVTQVWSEQWASALNKEKGRLLFPPFILTLDLPGLWVGFWE